MTPFSLEYFKEQEPHIFRFWHTLTQEQKIALENQLKQIDLKTLEHQRQLLQTNSSTDIPYEAFNDFAFSGNQNDQLQGNKLIKQGRLGCLLLAGGQGTRLQFAGPKGTYPISVIKQKSLFQLTAEKVRAASVWANLPLNLAIMTSPDNDEETRTFFQQHDHFGLHPTQVSFFIQHTLPLLNAQGHLILKNPAQLATGGDGNGTSLLSFAQAGILDQWIAQGVKYVHVILVDNPLADPFDAELIGFHQRQEVEITLKCTEKLQAEEKVGVLVKRKGNCCVVEYSEMQVQEKKAKRIDGGLKHCCANLSLFCFSLTFIQRIVSTQASLPLHKAWKATSYVDPAGVCQLASQSNHWKFETFIFDWLSHTSQVAALLYPREECFAPLKNLTGADSPETVRAALQQRDQKCIQALNGLPIPSFPFELAANFYYPTLKLINKWKRRPITFPYVEP